MEKAKGRVDGSVDEIPDDEDEAGGDEESEDDRVSFLSQVDLHDKVVQYWESICDWSMS